MAKVEGLDYPLVSAPMSFGVGSAGYDEASGPGQVLKNAPGLGEHNEAVMRELGLTEEQVEGLKEAGVISTASAKHARL
jgi:hypothetical protein